MAWLQSHQQLREHPKTKRAARTLGVSIPTMVGHLHLLWWWALDHALDGDLSRFDADDLADAAGWDGDPDLLVSALVECGPKGTAGFCDRIGGALVLHDWDEYGGKYQKRVSNARKGAKARWDKERSDQPEHAGAMLEHSDSKGGRNAEERRGEEKRKQSWSSAMTDGGFDEFWKAWPRKIGKAKARQAWDKATRTVDPAVIIAAVGAQKPALLSREPKFRPHATTWLNQRRWEDEVEAVEPPHGATAVSPATGEPMRYEAGRWWIIRFNQRVPAETPPAEWEAA